MAISRVPATASIRPMGEEDLGAVTAIEKATFPNPWPYEALAFELKQNPFCAAFVTQVETEVVAYAFLWVMYDRAHLINIAVADTWRGKGLGEALLRHCIHYARGNGAEVLYLEVREDNDAAVALYQKYGFIVRGTQANYYSDGSAALLMEAPLDPPRESA